MQLLFIIFFLISSSVVPFSFAAEIDSVTPRKLKLDNSLGFINIIFNYRIQEGIQKANSIQDNIEDMQENDYCDVNILYTELRKAIFQSYTASWGFRGYQLDKQLRSLLARQSYSLSLKESIYRDISYLEGITLNIKELSAVVNINGHLIGLDKIGHFFAQGWEYFELTQYENYSIDKALAWGKQLEAGKFGYTTTGIFSFADLVANFNGWRFWNKILLKEKDPLKGAIANFFNSSYVTCDIQIIASIKNKKIVKAWEYNSRFNLSDYLDGSWDEANNCNSYENPAIEEKVRLRIKYIDPDFKCPYIPDHCKGSQKKHGDYAKYILHPFCLIATDE